MIKLTLQHPNTGFIRQVPVGFSWTTLFFGPLPALRRGDLKWFFIQFILDSLFIIPAFIFPFKYNKLHLKKLLEAGYKVKLVQGASMDALNFQLGLELPMLPGK